MILASPRLLFPSVSLSRHDDVRAACGERNKGEYILMIMDRTRRERGCGVSVHEWLVWAEWRDKRLMDV